MRKEMFDLVVDMFQENITDVLRAKGEEYSSDTDRLHNFKVAARKSGMSPCHALLGMDMKHQVSIEDMVDGRLTVTLERVKEKVGDHINYMILLAALLLEDGIECGTVQLPGDEPNNLRHWACMQTLDAKRTGDPASTLVANDQEIDDILERFGERIIERLGQIKKANRKTRINAKARAKRAEKKAQAEKKATAKKAPAKKKTTKRGGKRGA
jgi:hypothetical protein